MYWFMVVSGTAFALVFPSFMLWRRRERIRKGKQRQPVYEKLVQDNDTVVFIAQFLGLWIAFVAPYWDWTLFKHSALVVIAFAFCAGKLAGWLLHRTKQGPHKNSGEA